VTSLAPESWSAPERPDGAPPPQRRDGADAWPAWTAPVALVTGLIGAFVGGIVVVLIAEAAGANAVDDTPPGVLLGATALQDAALIGAAIVFARMTGPVSAAQFGLRPTGFWRSVGAIVLIYIVFAIAAGIWTTIVGSPDEEPLLDELGVDESTLLLVLGMLTVCVAAPLVEEVFFRGFFYRALRNWAGVAGAAILTGLVFGAMHATSSPVEHLVPLAVLGALFCVLYHVTGSLYPCIVLHAINNSLAFGIDQDWDWQIAPLLAGSIALCGLIAWAAARRFGPDTR
jgi:hypothetical protein